MYREKERCWAEINPDHLAHNVSLIRKKIGNTTKMVGVVKADAYGHGAVAIAKRLEQLGADYLATACYQEACELRQNGLSLPILLLSQVCASQAKEMAASHMIPTVFDLEFAQQLNQAADGTKIKVHVKIDTGMTRLGFRYANDGSPSDEHTLHQLQSLFSLPNLEIEGIYSHFASADEEDGVSYTQLQFDRFIAVTEKLKQLGIHIPIRHICNSAATLLHPEMHLDMVRCGIILYGAYPSSYVREKSSSEEALKPLMSFRAKIAQIRMAPSSVPVSYGGKYVTVKEEKLAVVSTGYADGFRRALGNQFHVIIRGKYAPVCGTVCMDQIVVDISDIPEAKQGDTVTLIGREKDSKITADNMAEALSTISYEIFCLIGKRVPRIYTDSDPENC